MMLHLITTNHFPCCIIFAGITCIKELFSFNRLHLDINRSNYFEGDLCLNSLKETKILDKVAYHATIRSHIIANYCERYGALWTVAVEVFPEV